MNPAVMSAIKRGQRGPVLLKYSAGTDPRAMGLTVTGDTHRSYIDAAGVVRYPAANVPMYAARVFDSQGVSRIVWLLQPASTNLWTATEDLTNGTPWRRAAGVTITANATAAPDGNVTADKVVQPNSLTDNFVYETQDMTVGVPVTWSFFAKPGGYSWLRCQFETTPLRKVWIDTQNAVFGTVDPNITARVVPCSNGWNRYLMTYTPTTTEAARPLTTRIEQGNNDGGAFVGDGVSGVYLWGYQFERLPFGTSYIPNATLGALARIGEYATMPWPYPIAPMSVYESFVELGSRIMLSSNTAYWCLGHPGTAPAFIRYNRSAHIGAAFYGANGHTPGVDIASVLPNIGDNVEVRTMLRKLDAAGEARISLTNNGGVETQQAIGPILSDWLTASVNFGAKWSPPTTLSINGNDGGGLVGCVGYRELLFATGDHDMTYLRSL